MSTATVSITPAPVATLGATHTVEVPLLFGTWRDGGPGARLGGQGTGAEEVASGTGAGVDRLHPRRLAGVERSAIDGDRPKSVSSVEPGRVRSSLRRLR